MIYKKIFLFVVVLPFILVLSSCSDSPSSIGDDLVKGDKVTIEEFDTYTTPVEQSVTYFQETVPLGSATRLLVGKNENVEASTLIRFYFVLDDSTIEQVLNNEINVIDSKVRLPKDYTYGSENAEYGYTVHKINDAWSSTDFTADSLSILNYDQQDISSNHIETDTTTIFDIDNDVVLDWLEAYSDTSRTIGYGMYMKPTDNSNKIIGYSSVTSDVETSPNLIIVFEKPGVYVDTLTLVPVADTYVVTGSIPSVSSDNFVVQGGLTINSRMYFDLSLIPETAVISRADLTIYVDQEETKTGTDYTDSLFVYYLADSTNTDSLSNGAILDGDGEKFIGNIASIVQKWVSGNPNEGIYIVAALRVNGVEKFVLKGFDTADPELRPRLQIIYTDEK